MEKLIIVDAHGYLHRAYHALPPLTTSKGMPINAIYGFARMLFKLIEEYKPEYFALCFDSPGPTFREKIYPEYKATRKETEENLKTQFPLSRELAQNLELKSYEMQGFEADDLIATIAEKAKKSNIEIMIVSADKDLLQIVNGQIRVLNEPKQSLFDANKVLEKWGFKPEQLVDFLSLIGDVSDNVPGVPGIGEKTAIKLIQEYGSIKNLLSQIETVPPKIKEKIKENQTNLLKSQSLITLNKEAPIEFKLEECKLKPFRSDLLYPFFKKLEFHSLLNELNVKGLLQPSQKSSKPNQNYQVIFECQALEKLINSLNSSKIAISLETEKESSGKIHWVGFAFSWGVGHAAYVPLSHLYLNAPKQIELKKMFEILKPILENKEVQIIGHDLKSSLSLLNSHGIQIKNLYFDSMIASYCLDPSRKSFKLNDLASEFLNLEIGSIETFEKAISLGEIEIEKFKDGACQKADFAFQLSQALAIELKEKKCEELFYKIEMPLIDLLSEMESNGIKIDIQYLQSLEQSFTSQLQILEQKVYKLAEQEFNLNSSKQLSFILFEKLKLPPLKRKKTQISTDEETLNFLADLHELPKHLLKFREISKLKSTYVEGLLSAVNKKNSTIHTSFNQNGTATGRLSSSDPNLQNIPIRTELGKSIRRAFIPEEGSLFLSADYSQIDLRVLAHLSQDLKLIEAFKNGEDIHRATAAQVAHISLDAVTEEQRKNAKAINFGIVYGQQAYGLSQSLKISVSQAQEMIDLYFLKYSGVRDWMDKTIEDARKNGSVRTLLGRIRSIPELHAKNSSIRSFAERIAVNTPVQGTSADIIKIAMNHIAQKLKSHISKNIVKILLQVHDDLLFEVSEKALDEIANIIKIEMESAVELSVPLIADLKIGKNWAEMEPKK
ncbi:MAG: DNA polymerase I [Elusimicrobia bacterium]|nr:DNA polymerase I [Elusimicrobiota bacterium]